MSQPDMLAFGQMLKEYRKNKGLTQEMLAGIIGVQKAAISKYEKGRIKQIPKHIIYRLVIALNIPFDKLPEDIEASCSWESFTIFSPKEYSQREQLTNAAINLLFLAPTTEEDQLIPPYIETSDYLIISKDAYFPDKFNALKSYIEFLTYKYPSTPPEQSEQTTPPK